MQVGPIHIQIEDRSSFPTGAHLLLNWETIKALGLSIGKKIAVSFGNRRASVKIGTHAAAKTILLIRRSLADRLLIPFNFTIRVMYNRDNTELRLGPLLGILFSKEKFALADDGDSYTLFCKEAFEAAHLTGSFCYVTTLDKIRLDGREASGWILKNGEWKEYKLPLPNVFYNRLSNRLQEKSGEDYEMLQKIKDHGVGIFNERFLDKWDVYQQLSLTPAQQYLPMTKKYNTPRLLQSMLRTYPVLYLKPIHGSEGRGIIRLLRNTQGYIMDQTTLSSYDRQHFKKLSKMVKYLSPKLRKKTYLIQQGIDFIEWNGATIDFRALLQKNRFGNWKIISLIARMGNPRTFVSNLAQGGKLESAAKLLKQMKAQFSNLPNAKEMKTAAVEIANFLDAGLDGNYGELGIDLGVDTTGRIWLIEVNSKPSKKNDAISENVKRPRPSVLHLYEYVSYLSGFDKSKSTASTHKSLRLRPKNRR